MHYYHRYTTTIHTLKISLLALLLHLLLLSLLLPYIHYYYYSYYFYTTPTHLPEAGCDVASLPVVRPDVPLGHVADVNMCVNRTHPLQHVTKNSSSRRRGSSIRLYKPIFTTLK